MREIKFRIWVKQKEQIIYFDHFKLSSTNGFWGGTREVYQLETRKGIGTCEGNGYFHEDFAEYVKEDDYDLMQYTGLKDKNGKEIYEGDIVIAERILFGCVEIDKFTVVFEAGVFGYKYSASSISEDGVNFRRIFQIVPLLEFHKDKRDLDIMNPQIEVIGNIYEFDSKEEKKCIE